MTKFLALIILTVMTICPVYAATSSSSTKTTPVIGTTSAVPASKDTIAPSDVTSTSAVVGSSKVEPAAVKTVVAPEPTAAVTPSAPAATESKGWHPFGLFGGSDSKTKEAAPANVTPSASPTVSSPAAMPKRRNDDASGDAQPPKADPEQVLRGKVWTSESACKKEALKGQCSSIDCATHSGGACSDQTGMIWIYR